MNRWMKEQHCPILLFFYSKSYGNGVLRVFGWGAGSDYGQAWSNHVWTIFCVWISTFMVRYAQP
jgi:hypothetical protein